jgi:hypothetical protein
MAMLDAVPCARLPRPLCGAGPSAPKPAAGPSAPAPKPAAGPSGDIKEPTPASTLKRVLKRVGRGDRLRVTLEDAPWPVELKAALEHYGLALPFRAVFEVGREPAQHAPDLRGPLARAGHVAYASKKQLTKALKEQGLLAGHEAGEGSEEEEEGREEGGESEEEEEEDYDTSEDEN